jgi:hypothetical protein
MKDFAGSSITYYGLARNKLMNKYPRLAGVLVVLALICMTGLAIFLISDLISFATDPDHNEVLVGLDLKGPENDIVSMTGDKEMSGNIGANSSPSLEDVSLQTKEQNFVKPSQTNASPPSSQTAKEVVAASKSSSSSYIVKKHHSSSLSPAKSAKKSNDKSNLTNETSKSTTLTNQSMNVAIGAIINPAKDTSAREPVSIIKFKTNSSSRPKSEQGLNSNKARSSKGAAKKTNSKAIVTKSASSQKSKVRASSHAKKAQEARAKLNANRNRAAENIKKKAAQSRAKAASN